MKILGLIPARGGSKGVPRKNIKLLCGKPLIQYTIDAAIESKAFAEIMVSTEDEEIAEIAQQLGASIPFLRPKHLAEDKTPTIDAVIDVLETYLESGQHFDAVCLLQPTNPLRSAEVIQNSIDKFLYTGADSLLSVRKVPHEFNPHWTFEADQQGAFLRIATGETTIIPRRQELPTAYYRDGAIYLTTSKVILEQKSLYGQQISFIDLEGEPHVNIDTLSDWEQAEQLLCAE